jgi:hypothetical protein
VSEFPTILYMSPGPFVGPAVDGKATTYATRGVADAGALADALADGWHLTLPEAVAPRAVAAPAPSPAPASPETAPAAPERPAPVLSGRAALEEEAAKLGIKIDGRWSDKRLAAEIAAKKG